MFSYPVSLYSTLLAHKKEHIRRFAAESFSFLMRKVTCSSYRDIYTETCTRALFMFYLIEKVS